LKHWKRSTSWIYLRQRVKTLTVNNNDSSQSLYVSIKCKKKSLIQICLLLVQSCHIFWTLLNFLGNYHDSTLFDKAYAYILYPLPSMMLHTSTFLTSLLAWHRFRAADKPVRYFVDWKLANPSGWCSTS
jgi:hypothetical protein